jgi:hypothetical protein
MSCHGYVCMYLRAWEKRVSVRWAFIRLSLDRVDRVGPVVVCQRGSLDGLSLAEYDRSVLWRAVDEGVSHCLHRLA